MSNELHEARTPPASAYVMHYHMTREPFGEIIEDDLFYAEPGRQQKLDILLHLTQYGNELVVVTGPTGSGKTTLLQQYLRKALDSWVVARIDAQQGIDERKLTQQLFHQMGMDFHGATHSELFERMQHHFDALQHSARQAVLLVDNAEHLPVTALKRALEMGTLTSADHKPLLRVILFGTEELIPRFDDPLLAAHTHIVQRSVELLPFSPEQTTHYILHRLTAAGFPGGAPFSDNVLHKIHKQSHGWPGAINRLAHDTLIESLPSGGASPSELPGFNKLRAAAALSGLLILGALLYFQDEFNAWMNPSPVATEPAPVASPPPTATTPPPATAIEADAALAPEVNAGDLAPEPAPRQATSTAQSSRTEQSKITETAETTDAANTAQTTETVTQQSEINGKTGHTRNTENPTPAIAKASSTAPTTSAAPATPAASVASPSAAQHTLIPDDLPGHRHDWILQQDPDHYTLQLVAGAHIKTLREFLRRYHPHGTLAIYQGTRKGQPWFGLIRGHYPSKQAAINARRQLPATIRKQGPWVRRFAAVQKELARTP